MEGGKEVGAAMFSKFSGRGTAQQEGTVQACIECLTITSPTSIDPPPHPLTGDFLGHHHELVDATPANCLAVPGCGWSICNYNVISRAVSSLVVPCNS